MPFYSRCWIKGFEVTVCPEIGQGALRGNFKSLPEKTQDVSTWRKWFQTFDIFIFCLLFVMVVSKDLRVVVWLFAKAECELILAQLENFDIWCLCSKLETKVFKRMIYDYGWHIRLCRTYLHTYIFSAKIVVMMLTYAWHVYLHTFFGLKFILIKTLISNICIYR